MSRMFHAQTRAYMVVGLLFIFMVINFADKAVLGLAAAPIMHDLQLSHTQFGLIGTSFFALFSFSAIVFGFISDRVLARWMLAAMALAWSVCQAPMLVASWFGLIGSRIGLGLGEGAAYPVALQAAYKWFPNEHRAFATSMILIGGSAGFGLVAPMISGVIAIWSWRAAFGVLAVAGLAWCVVWLFLGDEGPLAGTPSPSGAEAEPMAPYRRLLLSRTIIGAQIVGFCAYWLVTLAVVWLPVYLEERFGFGLAAVGWIVALPALCQIAVVPAVCTLSEWLTRRGVSSQLARAYPAALCVTAAGVMAVLFAVLPGTILPLICMVLAFSVGNVILALGHVMVAEVTPARQCGAMLGVTNGLITLAGPFAPLVTGILVDAGPDHLRGFRMGFIGAGILVTIGGSVGLLLMNPDVDRRALIPKRADAPGSTEALSAPG
jgi:MFS transporter, ACS family, D-galactonate transporter